VLGAAFGVGRDVVGGDVLVVGGDVLVVVVEGSKSAENRKGVLKVSTVPAPLLVPSAVRSTSDVN
jgi:hypothetical protein